MEEALEQNGRGIGGRWERDGNGMGEGWERDGKGMAEGCAKDGRREILERNWRRVDEG